MLSQQVGFEALQGYNVVTHGESIPFHLFQDVYGYRMCVYVDTDMLTNMHGIRNS